MSVCVFVCGIGSKTVAIKCISHYRTFSPIVLSEEAFCLSVTKNPTYFQEMDFPPFLHCLGSD